MQWLFNQLVSWVVNVAASVTNVFGAIAIAIAASLLGIFNWHRRRRKKGKSGVEPSHLVWAGAIGAFLCAVTLLVGLVWQNYRGLDAYAASPPRSGPVQSSGPIAWNKFPEFGASFNEGVLSITSVGWTGSSIASKELTLQDAYIISGITGDKIALKVSTQEGLVSPAEIRPIPSQASVTVRAELEPRVPDRIFLRDWGSYDFVVRINDTEYRRNVSRAELVAVFEEMRTRMEDPFGSNNRPRVTKKK